MRPVHDVFSALRDGEQLVGREVELGAAQQQVGQQHDGHEQHADDGNATDTEMGFLEHGYFDLRRSSTTVLASRKKMVTSA